MTEFLDFLQKKEVKKFIKENLHSDLQKHILNPPKEFGSKITLIVDQITARKKAHGKLNNWAENFELIMPPPLSIEQASSESTASYKKNIVEGNHLVDLTGGMGIDTLALSEKFKKNTYVEQRKELCELFNYNSKILKTRIEIFNKPAETFLSINFNSGIEEGLVFFIDPSRRDNTKNKVFKLEDCTPNLKELIPKIKEKANQILVKLSPLVDIKSILSEFDSVKEVHVVSVRNECKELLVLIDNQYADEPEIIAINLESNQSEYRFKLSHEEGAKSEFSTLKPFLFEPNTSILKSGAFKKLGFDFGLHKLHQHTHLYTAEKAVKGFPGRIFKVITTADKAIIGKYADGGKINVLTRNYPIKPDAIKKKWKLKDGGDYFLIGFKDTNEKANLVIAERVN